MTCACGEPVHIKKRGLCQKCYQAWRLRERREVRMAADPTWKQKTRIARELQQSRLESIEMEKLASTFTRAFRSAKVILSFWDKVDRSAGPDECWPWTGFAFASNKKAPDYKLPRCTVAIAVRVSGKRYDAAHRVAYILSKGKIPDGMTVDHICFNPICCNPKHLQLLTRAENSARKDPRKKKGGELYKTPRDHCSRGHEFTPENTIARKAGRLCRTCRNASKQRRYRLSKEQQP